MRRTSGISLLVLIFLSLCLVTFSLLSLSGSVADANLSKKSAARTTEYYQANNTAHECLANIDESLAEHLRNAISSGADKAAWLDACAKLPQELPDIDWCDAPSGSDTLSYQVTINEKQRLLVELKLTFPEREQDTMYQILSWKVENTKEWRADTSEELLTRND